MKRFVVSKYTEDNLGQVGEGVGKVWYSQPRKKEGGHVDGSGS